MVEIIQNPCQHSRANYAAYTTPNPFSGCALPGCKFIATWRSISPISLCLIRCKPARQSLGGNASIPPSETAARGRKFVLPASRWPTWRLSLGL